MDQPGGSPEPFVPSWATSTPEEEEAALVPLLRARVAVLEGHVDRLLAAAGLPPRE